MKECKREVCSCEELGVVVAWRERKALSFDEELPGNIAKPFLLQKHVKVKEAAMENTHSKIYLDSKIMKHLDKLGLQMKRVTDKVSSSGRKKEEPQWKRVIVTRQPSRARHSNNKKSASVKPSQSRGHIKSRISMLSDHREDTRSVQEGGIDMQLDEPSGQFLSDGGPSGYVQKPQSLFNNVNIAWQLQSYNQQPADSQRHANNTFMPWHQPGQYHFNLAPNEFWRDYPVNVFPWNQ
ncbi:hypothetical protein E2C01_007098 [Portunus trituberculatus]|uniref:Uncharacterized protein n=1 Tax=Portunus trituberculatus TaxID=210409 RepID=A0A5B7CX80_PORTR|nr:hypothetical protein [Portunus trituberculatus]